MELPLFPLNTVLCPGIALPLHVFEDRYRALVRHCLETTSPFGIVLIREGREVGPGATSLRGVGTIAEIRDAGRHDDGSGESSEEIDVRIEVETEDDEEEADGEPDEEEPALDEASEPPSESPGASPEGGEDATPAAARPRRRRVLIPDDPTVLSHLLAGILQIELPRRQALLELATTEERLAAVLTLIDREIFLLRRRLRAFIPDARVVGPRRS